MNLTERLEKHLQSIREESISNVDLQKIYKMVPNRNSSYIEKAIYDFFLKPLEKGIESKKYIGYLERLNRKSSYLEMIEAFYLETIRTLKRLKSVDRYLYDEFVKEFGPLNKDNVFDWWYDFMIEGNPHPEPSEYWYEGGYDDKLEDLIKNGIRGIGHSAGFTVGEVETIKTLVQLFWDRVDRLEDNEAQQKALIKQLYK